MATQSLTKMRKKRSNKYEKQTCVGMIGAFFAIILAYYPLLNNKKMMLIKQMEQKRWYTYSWSATHR